MKKSAIYSILLIILAIFLITGLVVAQSDDTDPPCGKPLIEGCVGACGASFSESYIVPSNLAYCFETTGSSLCPNTGAEVTIYLNGIAKFKEDMTNGVFIAFVAQKDDIITIEANLFEIDNDIVCVWLGELYFKLAIYCVGDLNYNGDVDGLDLVLFIADFGRIDCQNYPFCEGDFDTDGDVDGSDLSIFAAAFGSTYCP